LIIPDDGLPADAFAPMRPAYGRGSLADLMPSVSAVLGVPGADDVLGLRGSLDGVDRVAVLLVDGLGAYQWPVVFGEPCARTLTSGFPSTTPVSLVTLGAGVPPGAHGVLGFTSRMPDGRILNHIRWQDDPDPAKWQPVPTRFETATAAGVPATQVTRAEFEGTGLTVAANRGARFRGGAHWEALASEMLLALRAGPGLVYGYHPDLDKAGHDSGLLSPQWNAAAADVQELVERLVEGLPPRAALLVTADHGQLNVPADARVDLIESDGIVAVAGEPRVRYLHVAPGAVADVTDAWRAVLGDRAWVLTREEVIDGGWFGAVPPDHFGRIGDIAVICQGRTVSLADGWEPPAIARMVAFHGSVTAAEMTVPLGVFVGGSG
jgi:Type I phosphodiesterase / nucleotide pyrophosphatase